MLLDLDKWNPFRFSRPSPERAREAEQGRAQLTDRHRNDKQASSSATPLYRRHRSGLAGRCPTHYIYSRTSSVTRSALTDHSETGLVTSALASSSRAWM
jgi:hypothetical protein